jgi:hypothetical protein
MILPTVPAPLRLLAPVAFVKFTVMVSKQVRASGISCVADLRFNRHVKVLYPRQLTSANRSGVSPTYFPP